MAENDALHDTQSNSSAPIIFTPIQALKDAKEFIGILKDKARPIIRRIKMAGQDKRAKLKQAGNTSEKWENYLDATHKTFRTRAILIELY